MENFFIRYAGKFERKIVKITEEEYFKVLFFEEKPKINNTDWLALQYVIQFDDGTEEDSSWYLNSKYVRNFSNMFYSGCIPFTKTDSGLYTVYAEFIPEIMLMEKNVDLDRDMLSIFESFEIKLSKMGLNPNYKEKYKMFIKFYNEYIKRLSE